MLSGEIAHKNNHHHYYHYSRIDWLAVFSFFSKNIPHIFKQMMDALISGGAPA